MMACEVWLRRDFLIRHGRDPGPPCDHPQDQCPEIGETQMNKTLDGFDEYQLSDDGGQTWRAATKDEYSEAQHAAGHRKRDGSPFAAWGNGNVTGRMYPLTKPGVEIRNFAEVEIHPSA